MVIVFDGVVQGQRGAHITAEQRRRESMAAMRELTVAPPLFLGYPDTEDAPASLVDNLRNIIERNKPERVWAPAIEENGHAQHNIVGRCVRALFPATQHYLTYTRTGGKSTNGVPVEIGPGDIQAKLRALACYDSQIELENCREHFTRDQREFYAA